jgi:hypothetical protein
MHRIKIGYIHGNIGHPAEVYAVIPYEDTLYALNAEYKAAGFNVIHEPDTSTPPNDVYYVELESDADLVKFKLQFKMPNLIHPFDDPNF